MKVIGLTGGIGAGKSTVSALLLEKGYPVIDADAISHRITEKGSRTLQHIAEIFGRDVLFADGSLDRKKLAAIVFGNEQKRLQLEELTTKKVIQIMEEQVLKLRTEGKYAIIFLDVPLLFETGADEMTDFVWLVTAEPDIRIARVTARDGISAEAVRQRMSSQMDEGEKIKRADELIDNSKGKEELYCQVERLLIKYAESE